MKKVISLILMTMLAICSLGLIACEGGLFGSTGPAHNFSRKVGVVEATCTTKGYIAYACTDEGCDAVKKEEIPALGHALVFTEQTAPTCTTNGAKKFKCLRASCTSGTIIEEIPALGHDVKTYEELSATCKEDGYDAYEECLRDGCNHNTYNKQDALGHEYDVDDKCIRCGSIDHDHVYDYTLGSVILAPTCTKDGQILYTCTLDNCTETEVAKVDALGHTFDDGVQTLAPTCTTKGSKLFNCTISGCNGTKTEDIDELGHDLEYVPELPATCTEDGYDAYEECLRDGCNHTTYNVQPATGHDIDKNRYCEKCDTTFDPVATELSTGLIVYDSSIYYGNTITFKGGKVTTTGGEEVKGTWSVDDSEFRLKSSTDSQITETLTATFTPNSYLYVPITTEVRISYKAVATYNSEYYFTLDGALTAANAKNSGTVTVLPNGDYYDKLTANTITIDEIKSGVTLSMPWATESQSVSGYSASSKASVNDVRVLGLVDGDGLDHAFKNQTNYLISVVIVGSNLINNGTINIGGVVSGNQGDEVTSQTAKEYTELDLDENVTLTNNGKINCYGYIDELKADTATLVNNGTIETPFSIGEHRGGSYFVGYKDSLDKSFTSSSGGASPFNRFFCLNTFVKTIHNPNSKVNGFVDLYANSSHNDSTITLIATKDNDSLISLDSNAILETKVDSTTLVNTMDFYGSFTLNALTVSIQYMGTQTMSTSKVLLPISWYFNVNMHKFKDGSESAVTLSQDIKLLPGAKMVIDSGVTVTANYITIYEIYPTSKSDLAAGACFKSGSEYVQYEKAYYNIPAELVVNGTLNVNTIGGTVKTTEDGAILNVKSGASAIVREVDNTTSGRYALFITTTVPVYKSTNINLTLPTLSGEEIVYTESAVGEYVSSNGAFALKTN